MRGKLWWAALDLVVVPPDFGCTGACVSALVDQTGAQRRKLVIIALKLPAMQSLK